MKTNLYVRDLTKFVLTKIENNENRIPYSNLNIEHIMPQTITDYWKQYVNDAGLYEQIVNRIGNLTLVDNRDNSGMSNKDFEKKKEYLFNTRHIKMNEDILNKSIWNEDEINKRSREIAKKFNSIFKYPDCDNLIKTKLNDKQYDVIEHDLDEISGYNPTILIIGGEINYIDSWTDVYKILLTKFYGIDSEKFISVINDLNDNVYDKPQISSNPTELRSPYMFVEDLYCETNKNTKEKITLIRRINNNMGLTINIKFIK